MTIFAGPRPMTRTEREKMLGAIVAQLHRVFGDQIIAIALYGSMARQEDLPFSDMELFCLVQGTEIEDAFEWVYGPSKAEVNLYSLDVAHLIAQEVDEWWPLAQGMFLDSRLLYGDENVLQELRSLVLSTPEADFKEAIHATVVGELYEWMGKLHNARHTGSMASVPSLACQFVHYTAIVLGLAFRTCYTTGSRLLTESLALPDLPDGYAELCHLVMSGELANSGQVMDSMLRLWQGLGPWGERQALDFAGLLTSHDDVLIRHQD